MEASHDRKNARGVINLEKDRVFGGGVVDLEKYRVPFSIPFRARKNARGVVDSEKDRVFGGGVVDLERLTVQLTALARKATHCTASGADHVYHHPAPACKCA